MTDLLRFDRRRLAALADPLLSDSWAVDRREEATNTDGDQSCAIRLNIVSVPHTNEAFLANIFPILVCFPAFRTPSAVGNPAVRCGGIPSPSRIVRHGGRETSGGGAKHSDG